MFHVWQLFKAIISVNCLFGVIGCTGGDKWTRVQKESSGSQGLCTTACMFSLLHTQLRMYTVCMYIYVQ